MKWDLRVFNNFIEFDANKVISRGLLLMGTGALKI